MNSYFPTKVSLIRFYFFNGSIDFEYYQEDQLYFENPQDYVLNNLEIFFFQKNFFFSETPIIIAYFKMCFILESLNYFVSYQLNFFVYLLIIFNLTNFHLSVYHFIHFTISFQEDFYLLKVSRQYLFQERLGYYFSYFKSKDANFIFN